MSAKKIKFESKYQALIHMSMYRPEDGPDSFRYEGTGEQEDMVQELLLIHDVIVLLQPGIYCYQ